MQTVFKVNISVSKRFFAALDSLGFGEYKEDAKAVVQEAKAVAAKKRRASTKLENLGIPEEELLRQQQELFAKVSVAPMNVKVASFSRLCSRPL